MFGVFLYVQNNLFFCFLIKFTSVPDVTPSSSTMDWFILCSVVGPTNVPITFVFKCIYAFCYVFVQGPRFTSVCGSWKYAYSYYS